jgi:predicted PurR-regulated permease PerM
MQKKKFQLFFARKKNMQKSLEDVSKELENLQNTVKELFLPKHMETMMKKVGTVESCVVSASNSVQSCYIVIAIVFFTLLLIIGFLGMRLLEQHRLYINVTKFNNLKPDVPTPMELARSKSL